MTSNRSVIRLVSCNMAQKQASWQDVATVGADIALLQEICQPPPEIPVRFAAGSLPWRNDPGPGEVWKCAVAKMTDRYEVVWHAPHLAEVLLPDEAPVLVMSMYARWKSQHPSVTKEWIYADASAHDLISELSAFIGTTMGHRIIAAGDLNILYGYGEYGSKHWRARYQSVFDRVRALGLRFCGPQFPNGRQADPWPDELPRESLNVPTFRPNHQPPEHAKRQLDFVFASESIADRIAVTALNGIDDWGTSDHCRVLIDLV